MRLTAIVGDSRGLGRRRRFRRSVLMLLAGEVLFTGNEAACMLEEWDSWCDSGTKIVPGDELVLPTGVEGPP